MIIGFTGKLGSGKDTAAERLASLVNLPNERIAFADKLKDSAAALFGIPREVMESNKNNPDARVYVTVGFRDVEEPLLEGGTLEEPQVIADLTFREILQRHGTEAHREVFGDNFWVDQALPLPAHAGQFALYDDKLYVVTDVRFPNELERVKELGGFVLRVNGENDETGTHASEQVLEGVDWEIDNRVRGDEYGWLDAQLLHFLNLNGFGRLIKATNSGLIVAS